jgi:hypothetical protein
MFVFKEPNVVTRVKNRLLVTSLILAVVGILACIAALLDILFF